jgi:hypothetical protein
MKRISLLACALAWAGGCGGGGDEKNVEKFLGEWKYGMAELMVTCPPAPAMKFPYMGSLTFAKGTDSDLAGTPSASTCSLKFDISGDTATLLPGQSCTIMSFETMLASWTLTTPDGKSGDMAFVGKAKALGMTCDSVGNHKVTK